MQIEKVYEPQRFEPHWAQWWIDSGIFRAAGTSAARSFSLVIPPPNVTGSLHIGHMLDGDLVRKHLSSELGFSKEHRDINIRRIGYVASEITKNGGIAVCAPIAPYEATRKAVRQLIEPFGGFILVHAATSIEVCEQRDRKGLYAKARAGILKE